MPPRVPPNIGTHYGALAAPRSSALLCAPLRSSAPAPHRPLLSVYFGPGPSSLMDPMICATGFSGGFVSGLAVAANGAGEHRRTSAAGRHAGRKEEAERGRRNPFSGGSRIWGFVLRVRGSGLLRTEGGAIEQCIEGGGGRRRRGGDAPPPQHHRDNTGTNQEHQLREKERRYITHNRRQSEVWGRINGTHVTC